MTTDPIRCNKCGGIVQDDGQCLCEIRAALIEGGRRMVARVVTDALKEPVQSEQESDR